MIDRDIAVQIAWSYMGQPYIWGGDDPIKGFDCSGLIVEILKSLGYISEEEDYTANNLISRFYRIHEISQYEVPDKGDIVFWQEPNGYFSHVEIAVSDRFSIGASGGGRRVRSIKDAIKYNAFVKVRPISREDDKRKVFFTKLNDFNTIF